MHAARHILGSSGGPAYQWVRGYSTAYNGSGNSSVAINSVTANQHNLILVCVINGVTTQTITVSDNMSNAYTSATHNVWTGGQMNVWWLEAPATYSSNLNISVQTGINNLIYDTAVFIYQGASNWTEVYDKWNYISVASGTTTNASTDLGYTLASRSLVIIPVEIENGPGNILTVNSYPASPWSSNRYLGNTWRLVDQITSTGDPTAVWNVTAPSAINGSDLYYHAIAFTGS